MSHDAILHLEASAHHLRLAGHTFLAEDVERKLAEMRREFDRAARQSMRVASSSDITARDFDEMEAFGVRFGAIYWIPGLLNRKDHNLSVVREIEVLSKPGRSTRKTQRFAKALKDETDPLSLMKMGWSGYIVTIEIAHAEADYGFIPHWSEYTLIPVYVSRIPQAIRIARVLRDRIIMSRAARDGEAVPKRNLWGEYIRRGRNVLPEAY